MDTTSSALARIFWVLAQRQDVQNKLRLEIREARKDGNDLTYDELDKLPYLDAICRETLRLLVVITYQELSLIKNWQISSCTLSHTNVSFHSLSVSHSDDFILYTTVLCMVLFFLSELRSRVWTEEKFQRFPSQKGPILSSVLCAATTTPRSGDPMPLSGSLNGGSSHCQTLSPLLGFPVFILICKYKFLQLKQIPESD